MFTDPVADMLTRLRNANSIRRKQVSMPASRLRVAIADVLKEEGFIKGFSVEAGAPSSTLHLELSYGIDGEQVIRHIERVSKPGRRVYARVHELSPVLRGQGIRIISTPQGVYSDRRARQLRIGGEVLARVY